MLAVSGCAVWKKSLSANGDIYVAINNCIIDFINTSNLFKADSIFAIDIIDGNGNTVKHYDSYADLKNEGGLLLPAGNYSIRATLIFSPINT